MRINFRPLALLSAVALGVATSPLLHASTVADYYFNGPISYSASGQTLSVNTGSQGAELISSTGLPSPFAVVPTDSPEAISRAAR
jgi:hypothetical protein